jgi:rubredoxin
MLIFVLGFPTMMVSPQPSIRLAGGLFAPGTPTSTKLGRPKGSGTATSTAGGTPSGQQIYNCQMCGKGYSAKGSLVRHNKYECPFTKMAVNFSCPYCNHKSRRMDHLKCHILTHMKQFQNKDFVMVNHEKKY